MTRRFLSLSSLLVLIACGPAGAQDVGTSILEGLQTQQQNLLDSTIGNLSVGSTAKREQDRAAGTEDLTFSTSPDLRRTVVAARIAALRAKDPAGAQVLDQQLALYDYDAIFGQILDGTGLSADDAGDVLTAYTALQWMIVDGFKAEPSPAALKAHRAQIMPTIRGNAALATPESRAAFAEDVKLGTVLLQAQAQTANASGTLPALADQVAAEFSPDGGLKQMALTEEGLVPRGGTAKAAEGAASQSAPGQPRAVQIDSPEGLRLEMRNEGVQPGDIEARLDAVVADLETTFGRALPGEAAKIDRSSGRGYATIARRFEGDTRTVHVLLTAEAGSAVCHLSVPATPEGGRAMAPVLQRCGTELNGQPAPRADAPTPPANAAVAPPQASTARFASNWAEVEGVFFQSASSVGVGGMVGITYEPMILFKDGTSYETGDTALEDVDLAAERSTKPRRFGTWQRQGGSYVLTAEGGEPQTYALQDGWFFQAFPAASGETLDIGYERMSGGGNSALGGEMTIAISSKIGFTRDGRFREGTSVGALGSGAQSGVSTSAGSDRTMAAPGRYKLDNHTLTLLYPDGHEERRFFAFGSQGDPARVDRDMIFVGEDVFSSED